jgi:hypothetical protein
LQPPRSRTYAEPSVGAACVIIGSVARRDDFPNPYPTLAAWFAIAVALCTVFYIPLWLLDAWNTRQWASDNPGLHIALMVLCIAFWVAVPLIYYWDKSLQRRAYEQALAERRALAAGQARCDGSGRVRNSVLPSQTPTCPVCGRPIQRPPSPDGVSAINVLVPDHLARPLEGDANRPIYMAG